MGERKNRVRAEVGDTAQVLVTVTLTEQGPMIGLTGADGGVLEISRGELTAAALGMVTTMRLAAKRLEEAGEGCGCPNCRQIEIGLDLTEAALRSVLSLMCGGLAVGEVVQVTSADFAVRH